VNIKSSNFDWFSIDRNQLFLFLYDLAPKVINKRIRTKTFMSLLQQHITSTFPIKIFIYGQKRITSSSIAIGGRYDSIADEEDRKSIELNFYYNIYDKTFKFSKTDFVWLCKQFSDIICHEIIHMHQYRRRKFRSLKDNSKKYISKNQQYYADKDEIEAYSFNIACDLYSKFGSIHEIKKYLNSNLDKPISYYLAEYMDSFDKNPKHPVIKKLKNQILKVLPKAKIGKPVIIS
jgi:hypothetical protein